MKQDIRDLFKEELLEERELPCNHRLDFEHKLNNLSEKKKTTNYLFMVAASISLLVLISSLFYTKEDRGQETPKIITEVQQLEQQYLTSIDKEWQQLLKITNDEKLIAHYEKTLNDLNVNYKKLSKRFSKNPNDVFVLEKLLDNLKHRLKILKDIKDHITVLNQKNETYETIIL